MGLQNMGKKWCKWLFAWYHCRTVEIDTNNLGTSARLFLKWHPYQVKIISNSMLITFLAVYNLYRKKKIPDFACWHYWLPRGTMQLATMKKCSVIAKKDLKREFLRLSLVWSMNIVAIRWFDNNVVNLVSWYAGVEPVWTVSRYAKVEWKMAKMFKLQNRILFCQL